MKILLLLLLAVVSAARQGAAQQVLKTESPVAPAWTEIDALLARVSGLPIEYRADLGLSILLQAHSVIPKAAAMEFLDGLFTSAHTARYASGFIYAGHNRQISSAATEADSVRIEKADALSIQTRVVEQMLKDSPEVAARRFAEIRPVAERATCADATVQDLSSYYGALQALFADPKVVAFSGEPRGQFLLDRFREAVTPEQIVPLLLVLSRIDPEPEDGQGALGIAAANLDSMTASGRELDALDLTLNQALQGVESYAERRHLPLTKLALAYRSFLIRSATTPACDGDAHSRKYTEVNFTIFRSRLSPEAQSIVPALTPSEVTTMDQGAAAADPQVAALAGLPPTLQQRLAGNGDLSAGNFWDLKAPAPITEEDASAALAALAQSGAQEGCDLCLFQARIRLLDALTHRQASSAPVRTLLVAEVDSLSQNPMEQQDPAAFLLPLKALIGSSRPTPASSRPNPAVSKTKAASAGDRPGGYSLPEVSAEPERVRQQLLLSSDPIISVYMQFEMLFRLVYTPTGYVGAAMS